MLRNIIPPEGWKQMQADTQVDEKPPTCNTQTLDAPNPDSLQEQDTTKKQENTTLEMGPESHNEPPIYTRIIPDAYKPHTNTGPDPPMNRTETLLAPTDDEHPVPRVRWIDGHEFVVIQTPQVEDKQHNQHLKHKTTNQKTTHQCTINSHQHQKNTCEPRQTHNTQRAPQPIPQRQKQKTITIVDLLRRQATKRRRQEEAATLKQPDTQADKTDKEAYDEPSARRTCQNTATPPNIIEQKTPPNDIVTPTPTNHRYLHIVTHNVRGLATNILSTIYN
ncbi:hypothetical protein Vafri_12282, partial [Volvox africanus]